MQRYEHIVKHFDKQLLNQLKDREYEVKKIQLENDNNDEDTFNKRILKIQMAGYLRNRFYFEHADSRQDFEKSKEIFYKETSLAVRDGQITDIGNINISTVAQP